MRTRLILALNDLVLQNNLAEVLSVQDTQVESRRQYVQHERFERRGKQKPIISDFITRSEVKQLFMNEALQVAPSNSLLLLLGETGVGKEHLAKVIHAKSPRSARGLPIRSGL